MKKERSECHLISSPILLSKLEMMLLPLNRTQMCSINIRPRISEFSCLRSLPGQSPGRAQCRWDTCRSYSLWWGPCWGRNPPGLVWTKKHICVWKSLVIAGIALIDFNSFRTSSKLSKLVFHLWKFFQGAEQLFHIGRLAHRSHPNRIRSLWVILQQQRRATR